MLGLSLLAVVTSVVVQKARASRSDPLAELRQMGATEFHSRYGTWSWHEFQFAESCSAVRPRLDRWKDTWITNEKFQVTDLEDRERGPIVWAPSGNWSLRMPITFRPGRNCGLEVGFQPQPSRTYLAFIKVRRLLTGK